MLDLEKVVEHLYDCLAASRPENMFVFVRKDVVGNAIRLLKKQKAEIYSLNEALDNITKMEHY